MDSHPTGRKGREARSGGAVQIVRDFDQSAVGIPAIDGFDGPRPFHPGSSPLPRHDRDGERRSVVGAPPDGEIVGVRRIVVARPLRSLVPQEQFVGGQGRRSTENGKQAEDFRHYHVPLLAG